MKRSVLFARDDSGMTIVEVMISAVIFFIVLTAILGLVGVTTNMGIEAKEKTTMTNAVNSYVERVQAMDFEDVVTDGSEGSLSVETTTSGDFTVTITPSVRPYVVNGETVTSLKYLDLTVTVSSARDATFSTTTTVTIRDRSELMSQAVGDPTTDPTIEWGSLTPPDGTVIWEHNWANGELFIDVDAAASEGRLVEAVNIYVNDRLLKTAADPPVEANWLPHAETFSTGATFVWDTQQTWLELQSDGVTEIPRQTVGDGMCTITAWVVDSENVRVPITRNFLIDNVAPPAPETPVPTADTDVQTTLDWPQVYDGTTPTDHYDVQLWRVSTPAELAEQPLVYWRSMPDQSSTTDVLVMETAPFSRYWAQVRSASPRHESAYTPVSRSWSSRPRVSGTYEVDYANSSKQYTTTVSLACTPPAFPVSSVSYRWERVDSSGVTVLGSTASTATDSVTGARRAGAPVLSYRCTVTYTRTGFDSPEAPITSNTAGPTTSSSGAIAEGTW